MTSPEPPALPLKKNRKRITWIILAVAVVVIVSITFLVKTVIDSGITRGPDVMFGDQHLKTAVALIELHKTRNGEYPVSIGDLKYTGQWDQLALQSVSYVCAPDRQSYYVEVQRGWIGKPKLRMPEDFWTGTGYNTDLISEMNK